MPKRSTTVAFAEPLDTRFRLFSEVANMPLTRVISEAVDSYITTYLNENSGVRAKFEARMLAAAGGKLSLIKPRKPKNDSSTREALK